MNELTISAVACTCCPYGRDFLSVFRYGVVGFCSLFCIFFDYFFVFFRFCHILDEKFVAVMFTALVSKINYGQLTD